MSNSPATVHIISLFPESMRPYLDTSIMQGAQEKGLFRYVLHNLTDWTTKNTRRVDDRPYGGGAGTIITVEPLTHALRSLESTYGDMDIFLMSPRGILLDQGHSEELAHTFITKNICIICGHYEGVDERIFDLFPIREVSIGEYVLSSGELSALVLIDSIVRLIPGVLSPESLEEESFSKKLLGKKEYPQYSRPVEFEGLVVPGPLTSGDPKQIQEWKTKNLR